MRILLSISRAIDAVTALIGRNVSWLILLAVLVSAYNAIVRYLGDSLPSFIPIPRASNKLLELQWYLYGTVFMLAAAYTLLQNEQIRIDIISNRLKKRTRDWVDLVCHLVMLIPFAFLMVWLAWPWFWRSYVSGEISANAGGLIIWPAKAMVLIGFILLSAQAISETIKRAAVLAGLIEDPTPQHELPPEAEAALDIEEAK